jgi:aspartyl protease family protein
MMRFVIGTVAFAALVGMLSKSETTDGKLNPPVAATVESAPAAPPTTVGNGFAETSLDRAPDGHFYADLMVNGTPVHFMVDTGASMVALTKEDAQRIGLQFSDGDFTGAAQTAGGQVKLKPVTLDRVTLGALEANQVEAAIVGEGLGQSLLGQSWLRQVGKVTIEGDRMVLR